jgi:signal peptidase I
LFATTDVKYVVAGLNAKAGVIDFRYGQRAPSARRPMMLEYAILPFACGGGMMPAEDETATRSPWLTVWFSPRATIEHLVAGPPMRAIWQLAVLGMIATIYQQLALAGVADLVGDWRYALALVLLGAVIGIAWLYLYAAVLGWVGGRLGGQAIARQLRVAFAWSMPPVIVSGAAVLVIGVAVGRSAMASGVVAILSLIFSAWSFVIFLLMLGRVERFGFWRTILTYLIGAVLLAFGFALFIRTFVYQPFNTPSGSMRPTLVVGDYFFASKFACGYSRFSLPSSPSLFSGRVLGSPPARGDVVVFRHPRDTATDYVKRVVGLPGDRIQMKQGQLYINDAPVKRERLADIMEQGACGGSGGVVKRWRETLPNGVSYETLDCLDNGQLDNTNVYTVPDGHFFALGDNRDNSSDSRVSQFGTVPFENLVGRVSLIFFSIDTGDGGTTPDIRNERIGMTVR